MSIHGGERSLVGLGESYGNETFRDLLHPDDCDRLDEATTAAFSAGAGSDFSLDVRYTHAETGAERWLEISSEVVETEDGSLHLLGTSRDVTERKEREQELERVNDLLTAAEEMADMGSWEYDVDTQELRWSDGTYDVYDVPRSVEPTPELMTEPHPDDHERIDAAFATAPETGDPVDMIVRRATDDGRDRWLDLYGWVHREDDAVLLRGTVQDVTERKERELELERHELVVRTASDPIYTVDPDGRFTMVNDVVRQHADGLGDPVGTPICTVFGEAHSEALEDRVAQLLADGEREGSVETVATFPDGTRRTYQTRIALEPFEEEYRGYACVSHDVTSLREHQRRLSVLDRVLRHNLRNKMNVVLGHANTLADASDPGVQQAAAAIGEAGEELLALGDAARRFQDTIDPEVDATVAADVTEHVRHVVEECRIDHPGAAFVTDLDGPVRARVPDVLDLVLTEIVDNTVVHCDHDDPQVEVSVTTDDDAVVVRVADDGPGVSSLTRRALARGSEGPLEHAMGLGLWLVRWTVAASDGTLDVAENEPRGTVVELRFPLAAE